MTPALEANKLLGTLLSAFKQARPTILGYSLSSEELRKTNADWRACNYLALLRNLRQIWALILIVAATACAAQTQLPFFEDFRAHNAQMAELQPAMVTPLVAADPRLIQFYRIAVSHEYTAAGTETTNFGNSRGGGVIVARRFEFDFTPPPYIQHNDAAKDGFGDVSVVGKVRIASGNAEHGNFDVAASLSHSFAIGEHKNGAETDSWTPTLVGVKDIGRFAFLSALNGTLPTGKIAAQGRTINWNTALQAHATRSVWFELGNSSAFFFDGPHDGKMQNFLMPGAFYVLRRRSWEAEHPFAVFATGMQFATSGFHTYNHNLLAEVRLVY